METDKGDLVGRLPSRRASLPARRPVSCLDREVDDVAKEQETSKKNGEEDVEAYDRGQSAV